MDRPREEKIESVRGKRGRSIYRERDKGSKAEKEREIINVRKIENDRGRKRFVESKQEV
jgi:hypothetical protein